MIINYSVKHPVSPPAAPSPGRAARGHGRALNPAISRQKYPPRKDFVRAVSLQTGYLIKANGDGACILYYLTQVDPRGECPQEGRGLTRSSPPWLSIPQAQGRRGAHPSPGGAAGSWCLPRGWPCSV